MCVRGIIIAGAQAAPMAHERAALGVGARACFARESAVQCGGVSKTADRGGAAATSETKCTEKTNHHPFTIRALYVFVVVVVVVVFFFRMFFNVKSRTPGT